MSKDKHYDNIKCFNTAKGGINRRTRKFEVELDKDNKPIYTKSLLVTFVGATDKFRLPSSLESKRLADWKLVQPNLQIVESVTYYLKEGSDKEFEATDELPTAVSGTYRPTAKFV